MNIKRYIDVAVRREIRRVSDGPYGASASVLCKKILGLLSSFQPQDEKQERAIEKATPMIKRIPRLHKWDEDNLGDKAHVECGKAAHLFRTSGLFNESPTGRQIGGLFDDLFDIL